MTDSYSTSYQIGNIRSGQHDLIATPGAQKRASSCYPALLVHGSGGSAAAFTYALNFGSIALGANVALSGGIPWMASDNDLQAWGNDQALADIDTQINFMATKFGTPANKIVLIGGSMGGYTVLRYAINNPSKVAAVIALIPLTDLIYFYNSNMGGAIAEIASAWGVTAPRMFTDLVTTNGSRAVSSATAGFSTADNGKVIWAASNVPIGTTLTYVSSTQATLSTPATGGGSGITASVLANLPNRADIMFSAASLTVPTKIYYSATDAIVFPSRQTAFAAAANGGAGVPIINVGSNGHSEQTLLDAQNYAGTHAKDMIDFLKAHGA